MATFQSWRSYYHFSHRVKAECRFVRSAEDEAFLKTVLETSTARIQDMQAGTILFRAQLGFKSREKEISPGKFDKVREPYPPGRMSPTNSHAKDGRANPKGIACLYLATDKDTAMAEVRPWLGLDVSLAQFQVIRPLKVVDCSIYHADAWKWYDDEPDDATKEKEVWRSIDRAFSAPVSIGDDHSDYVPTQIITELFKANGYDGIAYKSSLIEHGFNVALFDVRAAKLIWCGLHTLEKIDFKFEESGNPYFVKESSADESASS